MGGRKPVDYYINYTLQIAEECELHIEEVGVQTSRISNWIIEKI